MVVLMQTSTLDEQFLAIVCEDEDMLRAEFDAIIAASFDDPPPRQRQPAPRPACPPPRWGVRQAGISRCHAQPVLSMERWVRQRSPPWREAGDVDPETA
jgi:hypothetical protein